MSSSLDSQVTEKLSKLEILCFVANFKNFKPAAEAIMKLRGFHG